MNSSELCPCGSKNAFGDCCGPYLAGELAAPTAEALMRSRYTAYARGDEAYLLRTWHPATSPKSLALAEQRWIGLKISRVVGGGETDSEGEVEFTARYKVAGKGHRMSEHSQFTRLGGRWVYVGGLVS